MIESSFEIKIDFPSDTRGPERLFRTAAKLIESYNILDERLLSSISGGADSTLVLKDIRKGSLIVNLMRKIEISSQGELGRNEPENIPEYIAKSRKAVTEKIAELDEGNSDKILSEINTEIEKIAYDTGMINSVQFSPMSKLKLGEAINRIAESTDELTANEVAQISDNFTETGKDNYVIDIPKGKRVDIKEIEKALTDRVIENTTRVILVIKKPDFLGNSQWNFKRGNDSILAKISDQNWIDQFHSRQVLIAPGDALEADMKEVGTYDKHGNLINCSRELITVHKITESPYK